MMQFGCDWTHVQKVSKGSVVAAWEGIERHAIPGASALPSAVLVQDLTLLAERLSAVARATIPTTDQPSARAARVVVMDPRLARVPGAGAARVAAPPHRLLVFLDPHGSLLRPRFYGRRRGGWRYRVDRTRAMRRRGRTARQCGRRSADDRGVAP